MLPWATSVMHQNFTHSQGILWTSAIGRFNCLGLICGWRLVKLTHCKLNGRNCSCVSSTLQAVLSAPFALQFSEKSYIQDSFQIRWVMRYISCIQHIGQRQIVNRYLDIAFWGRNASQTFLSFRHSADKLCRMTLANTSKPNETV